MARQIPTIVVADGGIRTENMVRFLHPCCALNFPLFIQDGLKGMPAAREKWIQILGQVCPIVVGDLAHTLARSFRSMGDRLGWCGFANCTDQWAIEDRLVRLPSLSGIMKWVLLLCEVG